MDLGREKDVKSKTRKKLADDKEERARKCEKDISRGVRRPSDSPVVPRTRTQLKLFSHKKAPQLEGSAALRTAVEMVVQVVEPGEDSLLSAAALPSNFAFVSSIITFFTRTLNIHFHPALR